MPPSLRPLLAGLALAAFAAAAPAQSFSAPPRPRLAAGADTNDWEPYYDYAIAKLQRNRPEADAGFYWSSRLDPSRAEPWFARWVVFWLMQGGPRLEQYMRGDTRLTESAEIRAADSLRLRALVRNPFVYQGLRLMISDLLPGYWEDDATTRGWLAYAKPDLPGAVGIFGRAIARDTVRNAALHYPRALAFAAMGNADSAEAEMTSLIAAVQRVQSRRLVMAWESTEELHYALAFLRAARNALGPAREAAQTAVEQNAAFYPGWELLGRIGMAQRDTSAALRSFEQALLVEQGDAVLFADYAQALIQAGRGADAVTQLRKALVLEPWWARPHALLGAALEQQGDDAGALTEYRSYLDHASSSARDRMEVASRVRDLRAATAASKP